ncbi:histidine kinase [Flavobacterium cheongpyeongense]|uniref:Histidine kinase n=1 Tax=Flavobacterium cheongpyeongense TaxID=2212651 RepID=A0A2V4BPV5_9FLAO|nr:histidine kinase [Flavobacterium cheongpyeongense]PXY40965.1 histidine kinase [Flavobacterium cheongpyeongense]
MKFKLKKITSRRAFFIYVAFTILVTVSSVYILSNLITDLTEKANEELAQRNFIKKQEFMSQEFSKLLEQENRIKHVLKISNPENLSSNLEVLSSVQKTSPLIVNNWFQINDEKIQFATDSIATQAAITDTEKFILQHKNEAYISTIVLSGKEWIWRIYFKLISKKNTTVRCGYDISLKKFRDYLSTVDKTGNNYAFIFDKNGRCIYHPDSTFIGKNICKVYSIRSIDTVYSKKQDYVKRVTMSEFLKLDVIRFTKKFDLKGSQWFMCVNLPKVFDDENVDLIRKYATWIYSITTIMLLLIFYLFSYANRRAYKEKGIAIKEKNRLRVENEKIIKEKALIQLQQLKEQINPHFLFNSLNSLYMLMTSDVKTAQKFTLNLSRIYRYLIDPPKKNIVQLKNELLFIEKYIFLQQTRFKEELFFSIKIEDETALEKFIPYLAFQVVVENAIKHNMATQENPLTTQILIQKDQVVISNNLQKKAHSEPGANFGLKYLSSVYTFYSRTNFQTSEKDGNFVCILPLISIHS